MEDDALSECELLLRDADALALFLLTKRWEEDGLSPEPRRHLSTLDVLLLLLSHRTYAPDLFRNSRSPAEIECQRSRVPVPAAEPLGLPQLGHPIPVSSLLPPSSPLVRLLTEPTGRTASSSGRTPTARVSCLPTWKASSSPKGALAGKSLSAVISRWPHGKMRSQPPCHATCPSTSGFHRHYMGNGHFGYHSSSWSTWMVCCQPRLEVDTVY